MSDQTPSPPPAPEILAVLTRPGEMHPAAHGVYLKALGFACSLHTELRKGHRNVPYLTHLLDVSSTVLEDGGTLEAAVAGLLHDAVEDKNVTYDSLTTLFGERVSAIVRGCTDSGELRPGDAKGPFLERKKAHLAGLADRVRRIVAGSPHPEDVEVLTVTAADKLSNLRATLDDLDVCGDGYYANFKGGLFVTHWYYETVVGILAEGIPGSRAVHALQRELARLTTRRDAVAGALDDRAVPLAVVLADLDDGADPRFGRGRTERMSAELERTLVAREGLRVAGVAREAGADPRHAVETFLLDCFVPGAAKRWRADGKPFPADLVPFADAVLAD